MKQSKPIKHHAKKADLDRGYTFIAVTGLKAKERCKEWIINSGTSRHMTFQKELLTKNSRLLSQSDSEMDTSFKLWDLAVSKQLRSFAKEKKLQVG